MRETKGLLVPLTKEERKIIEHAAEESGRIPLAAFLRQAALEKARLLARDPQAA